MNIEESLRVVTREADPYAQAYAVVALDCWKEWSDDARKHQLLYVLDNLQSWRGQTARDCKVIIRDWIRTH